MRIYLRPTAMSLMVALHLCLTGFAFADDAAERFIREAQNRAEYWKARGHEFDPFLMSADSMDRHVENRQRAAYWAERGFRFDPAKLSAYAMDRAAEAVLRAEYWKRWGIEFDAQLMDAETMDDAAVKLQNAQTAIRELKKKLGDAPAMVFDQAAAKIMAEPPRVKGGQRIDRARLAGGSPPAVAAPIMVGGAGIGVGAGRANRGDVSPIGNAEIAAPQADGGRGTRRAGSSLQIPPGVDLEEFLLYLQRLGY